MADADSKHRLYRVAFYNQGEVYEVYAREIGQGGHSGLYGFVEIEQLVFREHTTVVIDPAEERLAEEFADVRRSYIPMHAIIRIDEVDRRGPAKVRPLDDAGSKVRPFPVYTRGGPGGGSGNQGGSGA